MLRCLLTLCLIVFSCHSLSSEKTPFVKVTSAWNKPSLITDNDPACQSLLEDAQSKFYSDIDWGAAYGVRGHGYVNTGEILDWTILGGYSLTSRMLTVKNSISIIICIMVAVEHVRGSNR